MSKDLLRWAVEAVLLTEKTGGNERGGDQVARRVTSPFEMLMHAPIHLGVAQRIQANANQPLLTFG